jgi:hypothetical protein
MNNVAAVSVIVRQRIRSSVFILLAPVIFFLMSSLVPAHRLRRMTGQASSPQISSRFYRCL